MSWQQADYFRVPLLDGSFAIGQVFEAEDTLDGAAFCGLSNRKTDATTAVRPLVPIDIIAFVFIDPTLLADGTWPLAGFDQIPRYRFFYDFDIQKVLGFPDMQVHDPAVIEAFLNAWHGLYPRDAFGNLFEDIKRHDVAWPL